MTGLKVCYACVLHNIFTTSSLSPGEAAFSHYLQDDIEAQQKAIGPDDVIIAPLFAYLVEKLEECTAHRSTAKFIESIE